MNSGSLDFFSANLSLFLANSVIEPNPSRSSFYYSGSGNTPSTAFSMASLNSSSTDGSLRAIKFVSDLWCLWVFTSFGTVSLSRPMLLLSKLASISLLEMRMACYSAYSKRF